MKKLTKIEKLALEIELELHTDDIEQCLEYARDDLEQGYITEHETSKGITAHYFDGEKEAIAFCEEGFIRVYWEEQAEEFCLGNLY